MERKKGERDKEFESTEGSMEGGGVARDVGSQDDLKRGFARPAGATRMRKEEKSKARRNSSR